MLPEYFTFVGSAIMVVSGISYIVGTVKGDTKPNKVTWFFWSLAPIIGAIAMWTRGTGLAALPVFMTGIIPLTIFCISFTNKNAYWQTSKSDYACGVAALVGLLLWYFTSNATLAIIFSILADFFAAIPTLQKAYTHPGSEDVRAYVIGAVGMFVALLAVQIYSFDTSAFIVYTMLVNGIIAAEIYVGKKWRTGVSLKENS